MGLEQKQRNVLLRSKNYFPQLDKGCNYNSLLRFLFSCNSSLKVQLYRNQSRVRLRVITRCAFLTGYERDNETSLDFAQARMYGSIYGRFNSIDPKASKILEPQSHNKYVYVLNNPLKFIDPTGETLVISGDEAAALVTELENVTGYSLIRCEKVNKNAGCSQVGQILINNKIPKLIGKGISEKLAAKLKNTIETLKDKNGNDVTVTLNTVKKADNYYFDSFSKKEIDVGDVQQTIRQDVAFGAGLIGHVLEEYSQAAVMKANDPDFIEMIYEAAGPSGTLTPTPATHGAGLSFESEVVGELLDLPASKREGGFANVSLPQTSFNYGKFRYDVSFDSTTTNGNTKTIFNVKTVRRVNIPQ